jgi:ketosteroid isomerase-like protein
MKNLIGFAIAAFVCFLGEFAQGQNCPNGKCPNTYSSSYSHYSNVPIEANVNGTKDMTAAEKEIVEIEKKALEKWYAGDPTPYINNMSSDIAYFEPILDKRLDGKQPLSKMFEALRGKVHADKFDMLNTRVQMAGDSAILSFNLIALEDGVPYRWNCTEIFAKGFDSQWKLIHSHWSQTKPPRNY